jgi:hypothetical protein
MELIKYNPNEDFNSQLLGFIKRMFLFNREKSDILSEDDLRKLEREVNLFKKNNIFHDNHSLCNLLYDKRQFGDKVNPLMKNGIYGLKSGVFIYHHYVKFILNNENQGLGDGYTIEINLDKLENNFESYFTDDSINIRGLIKKLTNNEVLFLLELFKGCKYLIDEHKSYLLQIEKQKVEERNQRKELGRLKHEENIRRKKEIEKEIEKQKEELEKERKIKHEENILSVISELDKDNNNEVDLVDDENYNKILVNNQKKIIEIDKNYIQKFVKISIYLKTKRSNIQNIFISINDTKNEKDLNELVNLLKNQIHTYDLLVFHSISMITSLVDSDLITFYQIYECFDQLGVFNSNWENEVSDKLTNIGNGIKDLMYSIYQMENKIVNSIGKLTYLTQSSYDNLNLSINNQLRNINSSLDYSNYMIKIQNYKMFNIIT